MAVCPVEDKQVCIICKNGDENNPLKVFSDSTWNTMKKSAEYRLSQKSDSYRETTLQVVNLQAEAVISRYHSKCYSNYTAVKNPSKSHQGNVLATKNVQQTTRYSSSMPDSDNRGILKGSCIFCSLNAKQSTDKWKHCQIVLLKMVLKVL